MHEVSLIESVVALVEDARIVNHFSRVLMIRLDVGALGHVEPEALRFCFDAVARGTIAEGARLEIAIIPGVGSCAACGESVPLDAHFAACPLCGNSDVRMTAGAEMRLAELEVE
jgi:hydrogenase nickel incorporation protein HypA/HybF